MIHVQSALFIIAAVQAAMLRVIEHTTERLVLHNRPLMMQLLAIPFMVFSLAFLGIITVQGYRLIFAPPSGQVEIIRIPALIVFLLLGLGFTGLGIYMVFNLSRGMWLVLDWPDASVTIRSAQLLRMKETRIPIYAVSHVRVKNSPEMRVFGLFLVLRSGEQIPLMTVPVHDREKMEDIVGLIRRFLRSR